MNLAASVISSVALNERAEKLLYALIRRYVLDGQPVGSRTLSRESALDLSPATIRNVMADLEDLGLVTSPHTSAGRVPTQLGYRFFVDAMMKVKPLDPRSFEEIREHLGQVGNRDIVIGNASELLSQLTHYAGVVKLTKRPQGLLRQVEFLPLSGNRVLAILVTSGAEVENRVLSTERQYSEGELVEAANYFNETYSGKTVEEVREALVSSMKRDNREADRIMRNTITVAQQLFESDDLVDDDVLISGETNLIGLPEFHEMEKLRGIFDAFKAKHNLLDLLDRSISGEGINIFIGDESGYDALTDCSVVTAPYHSDGRTVGVIGVIGPTRMSYETVIPVVDITARLLSSALSYTES
ncbi:MAG: heat-inducible transcription repressor HrcA [Proteobacteria bacterium]|nr:MAG: heat-inducible transcription repressor HrcA [Pseudomonadota bacterium]